MDESRHSSDKEQKETYKSSPRKYEDRADTDDDDGGMASERGDVLLISARSGMNLSDIYRDHLRKEILSDRKDIAIEIFHDDNYQRLDDAFCRNKFVFVLVTEAFCKLDWPSFSMEQCVKDSLYSKDRTCKLIPVLMESNIEYQVPMGLNSLTSLKFYNSDEVYKKRVRHLLLGSENTTNLA